MIIMNFMIIVDFMNIMNMNVMSAMEDMYISRRIIYNLSGHFYHTLSCLCRTVYIDRPSAIQTWGSSSYFPIYLIFMHHYTCFV